ncbi:Ribokinase-like protein [Hypoxylon sp. FL1284]|nr:Ribokinase-like protein [Hypoxylon sp. FL1284]
MSSDTAAEMSKISKETRRLLDKVHQLVPPMRKEYHKGQLGRVAVIGGSEDYTGAPYFSAMASARLGCDMSHVICTPGAAAVIKTYSPNLMVHPLMRQSPGGASAGSSAAADTDPGQISSKIIDMLPRLHVLKVLPAARERGMPVVLDADALALVAKAPELFMGWREVVLTPNVVEWGRLWDGVKPSFAGDDGSDPTARSKALAKALGGVTILEKGNEDYITDGRTTLVNDLPGGLKRSGGQGDTLTGSIATFLAWRKAYHEGLWNHSGDLSEEETMRLAVFGGAAITKCCSRMAYESRGRSLQASDLTEHVHAAFLEMIGEPKDSNSKGEKL